MWIDAEQLEKPPQAEAPTYWRIYDLVLVTHREGVFRVEARRNTPRGARYVVRNCETKVTCEVEAKDLRLYVDHTPVLSTYRFDTELRVMPVKRRKTRPKKPIPIPIPDSILITVSQHLLPPQHLRMFVASLRALQHTDNVWLYPLSRRPKYSPDWCYIAAGGWVRYRAQVIGCEMGGERNLYDRRVLEAKHWLVMGAPLTKAPVRIRAPHGQGFQYTEPLW